MSFACINYGVNYIVFPVGAVLTSNILDVEVKPVLVFFKMIILGNIKNSSHISPNTVLPKDLL